MAEGRTRLGLLALVTAGCAVAACTGGDAAQGAPPKPARPRVVFETHGGDSFAWTQTVSGRADCSDVALTVNGDPAGSPVPVRDASFRAKIRLRPGDNEVVARCDSGPGATDSSATLTFAERLAERPTANISVAVRGRTVILDGSKSSATRPDGSKVVRYQWAPDPQHPAHLITAAGTALHKARGPRLRLRAPRGDGEYYVALEVSDARGRSDTSATYFVVEDGRPRPVDMMHEHPSWIDSAVIYAPIPQLFGNGGPRSVQRRLPYLKRLGVDALWLWPPSEERAVGEEYAITDYFKLDPSWGNEPAFKKMVDEAHRLGMHVMIDFVPNHMSDQSPYFKDAKSFGEDSRYWDFFDRNREGKPTHYFDWTNLPNLNYDNPEVRSMIIEASSHWVRDLGIDGFRVDAAWGVKRRRPQFWTEWRRALKRINPDLLLLAEASAVDPYYFSHGFDVAYDWTSHPGQWAWGSAFEFPQEAGALLAPAISNGKDGYARNALVMRFLNNNDTGARFVDQFFSDVTRVAAAMQFTLPGVPEMFAGDEIGASYEPYSNLTPIVWRDRFSLRPFYEQLINLKHRVPALASSRVAVLPASPNSALAYVRPGVHKGGPVLVILNFGSKTHVQITGGSALDAALGSGSGLMRDLLTGDRVQLKVSGESASIAMDAASYLVLEPGGPR